VLVPDVLGALAVWWQNIGKKLKKTPWYVGAEGMMTKKRKKDEFRHRLPSGTNNKRSQPEIAVAITCIS